jgi:hypothetical protein
MDYDDVFSEACDFCRKEDWENSSLTFLKALSLAPNDEEKGKCCYMSADSILEMFKISGEKELFNMAVASLTKSADYGFKGALDTLKRLGINYTPQKPSSSSAPNSGGSSATATPKATPRPAAQPAPPPQAPQPAAPINNVWEFSPQRYTQVEEVYKKVGQRVKKGDKLLKYHGKILKSEVEGTITYILPFSCGTDGVFVKIAIGK